MGSGPVPDRLALAPALPDRGHHATFLILIFGLGHLRESGREFSASSRDGAFLHVAVALPLLTSWHIAFMRIGALERRRS